MCFRVQREGRWKWKNFIYDIMISINEKVNLVFGWTFLVGQPPSPQIYLTTLESGFKSIRKFQNLCELTKGVLCVVNITVRVEKQNWKHINGGYWILMQCSYLFLKEFRSRKLAAQQNVRRVFVLDWIHFLS